MKKIIKHFKNNWYRYGLETLVVIVGILVAFTLNSWNEARKNRALEKAYIKITTNLGKLNIEDTLESKLVFLKLY